MEFLNRAVELVIAYYNNRFGDANNQLKTNQVYVIWFSYALGNWKALLSTEKTDGMYYELTYDKDLGRTYIDTYKKIENVFISDIVAPPKRG